MMGVVHMAKVNTSLSNDLDTADLKAQYDEHVKNILANKIILAWIVRHTIEDFFTESIENIIELIEGEAQVSEVEIEPGHTNSSKITGNNTEDKVPGEGTITFDIKFNIFTPSRNRIKLIVNIEAQKDFFKRYDLVTRGVFYGARMISSQKDREFSGDDYDSIKKVYSIWICMNAPEYAQNTITSYKLHQKKIFGDYSGKARFDILEVIMICLGKTDRKESSDLIDMLSVLLSDKIYAADKKVILENEYGINSTENMDKELREMCNLSDLVEERAMEHGYKHGMEQGMEHGYKRGMEQGMQQGMRQGMQQGMQRGDARTLISIVDKCMKKNGFTIEMTLESLDISMEDYENAKDIIAKYA